jgi:hypothetical protein
VGLLDDAIREHLDLKRRHGADPSEVERAEREALGPVRRAPEAATELEFEDQAAGGQPAAFDHQDEQDWDEPALEAEPDETEERPGSSGGMGRFLRRRSRPAPEPPEKPFADEDAHLAYEPSPLQEDQAEDRRPAPASSAPPAPAAEEEDLTPPDPRPASTPKPHPAGGPAGGETVEYDVADALQQSPVEADEDVLEETPEFLQDTPDHDRLWFEQRPPRDFDFDE